MSFTEGSYEKALIALFENLGYQHQYGPNIERDYYVPFYEEQLIESLTTINYGKPRPAIDEAISKLKDIEIGSLPQRNELFMDYLQHGIEVSFFDGKEQCNDIIYLIDYNDKNIKRNDFKVINQWTFVENSEKRADIILFVNGLPLVVIELKSPSREETNVSEAYLQLRNYMKEIPSLFVYNAFCVMSDMACSKAGTITSNEDRYMEWKTKDGKYESSQFIDYDTFFEGIFIKERFIDIIKNFICFSKEESDRLTKLKNSISVDDNNYILVGKFKSKGESLILSANPVQKITEQEQQPAKEEPVKTAVQSEVASEADTVWSVSPYSAILPDAIDYFRTHINIKIGIRKRASASLCVA